MTAWNSLHFPQVERATLVETLKASLTELGYALYNPFGVIPGRSYSRTVRLFVGPEQDGWLRVIGFPDERLLPLVSQQSKCLHLALAGSQGGITVYAGGQQVEAELALAPHLRTGSGREALQAALSGDVQASGSADAPEGLPFSALPADVQSLAGGVDEAKAQKMFAKLSGKLLGKVQGADQDMAGAARGLLAGGEDAPTWGSEMGQRIIALMDCLDVPAGWREPEFAALSDAYQLYTRRQRNPDARLYPGDEESMARVPDALTYVPIYAGAET